MSSAPKGKKMTAYMPKAKSVEWATPWPLFRKLDEEFHFTLDVCALDGNTKCALFYTPEQDGLLKDWAPHTCWCNPPYGATNIEQWLRKGRSEAGKGATVVYLIPATTDVIWFHEFVWDREENHTRPGVELRFFKGRINFAGVENGGNIKPSMLVIFRPLGKKGHFQ